MKNSFYRINKAILTVVFTVIFCGFGFGQTSLPLSRTNWDATPAGWTDNGTGSYITTFACTNSNSGKLDNTGDYYEVYFNSQPDQLVFKLKKASMSGESYLIIEESADGSNWSQIGNYGTGSASTSFIDCNDITISLNSTTRYVKWTYTKASGNCVIDDVNITSAITKLEPTNHAASFTATANGHNQIDLSWLDNDGTYAADGFLIKANTSGTFTDPTDGTDPAEDTDLSDGTALVKVAYGNESYSFTGLSATTQYYFKIWPYTNSASYIDFKTDATVPEDNAITTTIPVAPSVGAVYITEVSDASNDYNAEFIELYNTSDDIIDLSDCKIVMDATTNFPITNYSGDYQIPAKGFLIIARSATLTEFKAEWSALPVNVNYNEGSSAMYFGTNTARRWQLVYNDGSKADIIIDDSQTAVGGNGNSSIQETPGNWTTNTVGNATPGALEPGDQQTLPILLTSFTAENKQNSNLINWTTASETNNAFFTLEK